MSHKCTYYDEGYCLKEYGETCPYNGADEQCECLEYEPKENYIATFTREALKELNRFDIHSDTWEQWHKVCEGETNDFTRSKMTLQEAKRQGAEEFAEMLKEKAGTSFDHFMGFQKVVLAEQIDGLLEEYKK